MRASATPRTPRCCTIGGGLARLAAILLAGACQRPPPSAAPQTEREVAPRGFAEFVSTIDASVDPCIDFYGYACGRSPGDGAPGTTIELYYRLDTAMWKWMTSAVEDEVPADDVRRFLAACLSPADGQAALLRELEVIDAVSGVADFLTVSARLQRLEIDTLFSLRQHGTPDGYAAVLVAWGTNAEAAELGLSSRGDDRDGYAARIARRLGRPGAEAPAGLAQRVVEFEAALRSVYTPATSAVVSPAELAAQAGGAWAPYIEGLGLPDDTTLTIHRSDYDAAVLELLGRTDVAVLRGYATWRLLDALAADLPAAWAAEGDVAQERSVFCTERVLELLDWSALRAFGRAGAAVESRAVAVALFEAIREQVGAEIVGDRGWPAALAAGIASAQRTTQLRIGWPDRAWDPPTMSGDDHLANVVALRRHQSERILAGRYGFAEGRLGGRPLQTFSAWNDPRFHGVDVGLALLQSPLFDPDRPHWMNLASLGVIMAHELHHSLGADTLPDLLARVGAATVDATPVADQHGCLSGAYEVAMPELASVLQEKHGHHSTWVDETACDVGALTRVLPLVAAERDAGRAPVPVPYEVDRLYFVGFARYFCDGNDGPMRQSARARMNLAVAAMPEFAEAYDCAPDAPEVLEHACWPL